MDKNDGGPAFPQPLYDEEGYEKNLIRGMSLRDHFAAKAMTGMLANSYGDGQNQPLSQANSAEIATMAYEQADQMLKARES